MYYLKERKTNCRAIKDELYARHVCQSGTEWSGIVK